jgi:hypothetical protein
MLPWLYIYVATEYFNVSPVSDICYSKCFMLQVFSLASIVCFIHFRYMFHMNVTCVLSRCYKSRSGVVNVDLVPTCLYVHGCATHKQGAQQHPGAWAWVVPTCMHGRVARNEAKRAATSIGLRAYVQHHLGVGGQAHGCSLHVEPERHATTGAVCGHTHQACGMDTTSEAGAGVI